MEGKCLFVFHYLCAKHAHILQGASPERAQAIGNRYNYCGFRISRTLNFNTELPSHQR